MLRVLDELLWTRAQFSADVVSGPVVPIFTEDVADWIKGGRFFYRQIHESGKALNWFATNNVLISRRVLNQLSSLAAAYGPGTQGRHLHAAFLPIEMKPGLATS